MTSEQIAVGLNFFDAVDNIDVALPKLKAFIKAINDNPAMINMIAMLFPQLKPILPMLREVGPWIDFLQQMVDTIQLADQTPKQ